MRSELDIRSLAACASDSAGLTRRQLLVVTLLTCVPLPLLSLGAAVVSLPELVQRAATDLIPFATRPLEADGRVVGPIVDVDLPRRSAPALGHRAPDTSSAPRAESEKTVAQSPSPAPTRPSRGGGTDDSGGPADPPPRPPTPAAPSGENLPPAAPDPPETARPQPSPPSPVPVPPPAPPSSPVAPAPPPPTLPELPVLPELPPLLDLPPLPELPLPPLPGPLPPLPLGS
jgi:hypothetical protein